MKKIILSLVLALSAIALVPNVQAQMQQERTPYYQDYQHDNRWRSNNFYTVRRYRYVRFGYNTYLEIWAYTYNKHNRLVGRRLIMRDRIYAYDRYDERQLRDKGIRLNIFLSL